MLDRPALDTQERRGLVAIELDAEVRDVAIGSNQIVLDVDRADDLVERAVCASGPPTST
jgi:hypothetical protein